MQIFSAKYQLCLGLSAYYLCYLPTAFAVSELPILTVYAQPERLTQRIINPKLLDSEDIAIGHERSITDVLAGLPGISLNNGGFGQQTGLVMRGAGGQGIVSLDGIPLFSSFPGLLNLDVLPTESLQKAEITYGANAAYQSFQALGGAIQLFSRDNKKTTAGLNVEGGSYGILRETFNGSYASAAGNRATVALSRGDAFDGTHLADADHNPERDGFRYTQGVVNAAADINPRLHWQGSMLYRNSWAGSDKLGLDDQRRVAFVDDKLSFSHNENWLAQNKLRLEVSKHWNSEVQLGYTQLNNYGQAGSIKSRINNRMYLVNLHNQHTLLDDSSGQVHWQLDWGGQGRHEQGAAQTLPADFKEERTMASGFFSTAAQYRNLSGEAGVRLEHYDHYGKHVLFQSALAWKPQADLTVRASGGTGYRIPSYTELLTLFFGNRALVPESSAGGELGLEWQALKNLRFNLKGFHQHYQNLITQGYDVQKALLTMNIPSANITGTELEAQYAWTDTLDTGISYTYNDSSDTNTQRPLPLRPPHIARVWGQQKLTLLPVTLWAEAVTRSSTWFDPANTIAVNQSVQLNAAVRYHVNSHVEVYVRGENLSNNRTPQLYSVDKPGVAVYGGIQVQL